VLAYARILALFACAAVAPAGATPLDPWVGGTWTSRVDMTLNAIHMGIVRAPADQTKVISWGLYNPAGMRVWRWDAASPNSQAWTTLTWPAGLQNMFCAGHTVRPDGRLQVLGGHAGGTSGHNQVAVWDAGTEMWSASGQVPQLPTGRWYPTGLTMGTGETAVFSGNLYSYSLLVGGSGATGLTDFNDAKALKQWAPYSWANPWMTDPPPTPRYGFTLTRLENTDRFVLFGGATSTSQLLNDVWLLSREEDDHGWHWKWTSIAPTNAGPSPRLYHAAASDPTKPTLYVFGGRAADSGNLVDAVSKNDVWRLVFDVTPTTISATWEQVTPSGTLPVARYGHTGVSEYLPIQQPSLSFQPALFFFGGEILDGSFPSRVWVLQLTPTPTWVALDLPNGPGKRVFPSAASFEYPTETHAHDEDEEDLASPDNGFSAHPTASEKAVDIYGNDIWFYGGLDESSVPTSDLYRLNRNSAGDLSWIHVTPVGGNPTPARLFPAFGFDSQSARLVLFGGIAQGSLLQDFWSYTPGDQVPQWTLQAATGAPSARYGAAFAMHLSPIHNLRPGRQSTGDAWSEYTSPSAEHRQNLYPLMFQGPSGRILDFGRDSSVVTKFDPAGSGTWSTLPWASEVRGHSAAIMIRGGQAQILKCCGDFAGLTIPGCIEDPNIGISQNKSELFRIDANDNRDDQPGDHAQQMSPELTGRGSPTLTVLPTGDVIVMGGIGNEKYPQCTAVQQPQIWDAATNHWGDRLNPDPAKRGYHSVALLMPDGRILTAGGSTGKVYPDPLPDMNTSSVFTPPYLYRPNSTTPVTPAERPQFTIDAPELHYADAFTVNLVNRTVSQVRTISLIRPGASTHAFTQDQRYIQLDFGLAGNPPHVVAGLPASGNWAPPGDYLMFVVDTDGIPSMGKWVTLRTDQMPPATTTDLAATTGKTMVTTSWTAPGDDGNYGPAVAYDLRYKPGVNTITDLASFLTATQAPTGTPGAPGTPECVTIFGLSCTAQHYTVALRTRDESGNWSQISNIVTTTVGCKLNDVACSPAAVGVPNGDPEVALDHTVLSPPWPNPARNQVGLSYAIPTELKGSGVELAVYDVVGRRVRTLLRGAVPAGRGFTTWNLLDERGASVRPGTYWVRLRTPQAEIVRTVLVRP
jgi:hypothetical protein